MDTASWRMRPEEGGTAREPSWLFFCVSWSIQGTGALRLASTVGLSRMLQVAGGATGEEAAPFSRDAVEEGATLGEGEFWGDWASVPAPVEDIIVEV